MPVFALAEAAFRLYDYNGNGYITEDEMTLYLLSVFRVLQLTEDGDQVNRVSPEELAMMTARSAFEQCDLVRFCLVWQLAIRS